MFTEVVGCNIPKVLMVANERERHEQFIMQFLNTLMVWGVGRGYDHLLEKSIFKSSPLYRDMLEGKGNAHTFTEAKEWHQIGKTSALYGFVAAWIGTLPFLRNAMTIHQTGATNFAQMSGLQSYDRNDPTHKAEEEKAFHKNLNISLASNAFGISVGLLGALASRKAMVQTLEGKTPDKALLKFRDLVRGFDEGFKKLPLIGSKDPKASVLFKDGQFSNFDGLPLVVSWILPGYLGYLVSTRDPVEAAENVLATVIALFSFEAGPSAIRRVIETRMKNNPNHAFARHAVKNLGSVQNTGQLSKMLISTGLYGMLPTGLNLLSRPLRAKLVGMKDKESTGKEASPKKNLPIETQPDIAEDNFSFYSSTLNLKKKPQAKSLKAIYQPATKTNELKKKQVKVLG